MFPLGLRGPFVHTSRKILGARWRRGRIWFTLVYGECFSLLLPYELVHSSMGFCIRKNTTVKKDLGPRAKNYGLSSSLNG